MLGCFSLSLIHTVLPDLKKKRDALKRRLGNAEPPAKATLSANQLREWSEEQLTRLKDLATQAEVDLADRQLVESFVQRIEINPDEKTGVVVLHADLESAFISTRVQSWNDPTKDEAATKC